MSLGGRIARQGKAVTSVSRTLSSAPSEPLLFLYPQWIRTTVTIAQAADRDGSRNSASEEGTIPADLDIGKRIDGLLDKSGRTSSQSGSRQAEPIIPVQPINSNARRIVGKVKRTNSRFATENRVRESYQETLHREREREKGAEITDWREILKTLERHTPVRSDTWHNNALRIKIPVKAVGYFLFSEDDNLWKIKDRCGVHIDLTDAWDDDADHRALILSGPVTAVAKASAEIMQVSPKAAASGLNTPKGFSHFSTRSQSVPPAAKMGDAPVRSVVRIVRSDRRSRSLAPMRADRLPRPQSWDTSSLSGYVQALTSMEITSHQARLLYKPNETHQDVVVATLNKLFLDEIPKDAVSASVFNDALTYLVKHNQMEDARKLYVHMEAQDLKMDTDTYNIMLRGSAKAKDLYTFRFLLNLMLRRGYNPNPRTWSAFLMAVKEFEVKVQVLSSMRLRNLLDDISVRKDVCEQLVTHEINKSLDMERSQGKFLTHMDEQYGIDWLTTSSSSRVLSALASRGLISRCWDFFVVMKDRDIKINTVAVNAVLDHCARHRNAEGAGEIIARVSTLQAFVPDDHTYHILFKIAVDRRQYNVARIVWQYACLEAKTTFSMRKSVQQAIKDSRDPADNIESIPKGKGTHKSKTFPLMTTTTMTPFGLPVEDAMQRLKMSPKEMVQHDLGVFTDWEATRPFVHVLREALDLDMGSEKLKSAETDTIDLRLKRRKHLTLRRPQSRWSV